MSSTQISAHDSRSEGTHLTYRSEDRDALVVLISSVYKWQMRGGMMQLVSVKAFAKTKEP